MARCLIVYFSQTGSTAIIAAAIAAAFRSAGWDIDVCNLKDESPPAVSNYEMIGFGFPVYYFHLPKHFRAYVESLPDLSQKQVFVFLLYGTSPGCSGREINDVLLRKKANIRGLLQTKGANYFPGYLQEGWLLSPENPTIAELGEAELFGRTMAVSPSDGMMFGGVEDFRRALFCVSKIFTGRWLAKVVYSRLFTVDNTKCDKCSLCVQQCPAGNIKNRQKNGWPVWGRQCILCFTCERICPKEAIKSPLDVFISKIIIRYFLQKALLNPTISRIPVRHRHGKTEKIR